MWLEVVAMLISIQESQSDLLLRAGDSFVGKLFKNMEV